MAARIQIPEGTRFGEWVTIGPVFMGDGKSKVSVRCDCGTVKDIMATCLVNGKTAHCREHKNATAKRRAVITYLVREKSQPCIDCGDSFAPHCMEFDHIPGRGEKKFGVNVNAYMHSYTLEEVQEERAKCDLVCAVCHRRRTWERMNFEIAPWVKTEYQGVFCSSCGWMGCDCCNISSEKTPFYSCGERIICATCYFASYYKKLKIKVWP